MLLIVLLTEITKGDRHLFFLFITGLPGRYEIVRLKQCVLFSVGRSDVQTVFVEHDSLALRLWVSSVLKNHVMVKRRHREIHNTYALSFCLHFLYVFRPIFVSFLCVEQGRFPFSLTVYIIDNVMIILKVERG